MFTRRKTPARFPAVLGGEIRAAWPLTFTSHLCLVERLRSSVRLMCMSWTGGQKQEYLERLRQAPGQGIKLTFTLTATSTGTSCLPDCEMRIWNRSEWGGEKVTSQSWNTRDGSGRWEFPVWILQIVWWLSNAEWCLGLGGGAGDEMWFQVPSAEACTPHIEAIAGQFSVLLQTLGQSDKMSRYIPEWRAPPSRAWAGIPPEPRRNRFSCNARISFIHRRDQAKPAGAELDCRPPETAQNRAETNIVEDQSLPQLQQ